MYIGCYGNKTQLCDVAGYCGAYVIHNTHATCTMVAMVTLVIHLESKDETPVPCDTHATFCNGCYGNRDIESKDETLVPCDTHATFFHGCY